MDSRTPPTPEEPVVVEATRPTDGFFAAMRRLGVTRADDRWVAGVGAGVADRFGIDPLLVRGIFAASLLLGGFGLVVYGIAWALLPERRDGRIHAEEMVLGRFDVALLGAFAFVLVGFGRGDTWFFFWGPPGWIQGLLWMLFVAGIVAIVLVVVNQRPRPAPYGQPQPMPTAPPGPQDQPTQPGGYAPAADPTTPPDHASTTTAAAPVYTAPVYTAPAAYAPTAYAAPTYTPPPPASPTAERAGQHHRPPRPPRPPKPRTPGAGAGTVGVVVALSLLTLAALLILERTGTFDGPVALTALGVAIVLAGLGIIVSGLRGRTSGALGALAVLGLIAAVPLGVVSSASPYWQHDGQHQFTASDVAPTSRQDAANGYSMGFGDVTIDLTGVPMTGTTLVVPISLTAGNLKVIVPEGTRVKADVDMGAGTATWNVAGDQRQQDGVAIHDGSFSTGGTPQLHLQIHVGAGQVDIADGTPSAAPPLAPAPSTPTGEETP